MEMYANSSQNNTLPVELQYCFEHQAAPVALDANGYPSLTIDSSGMNVPNMSMNSNHMSNLGLLNLEIPGFCPLDLN